MVTNRYLQSWSHIYGYLQVCFDTQCKITARFMNACIYLSGRAYHVNGSWDIWSERVYKLNLVVVIFNNNYVHLWLSWYAKGILFDKCPIFSNMTSCLQLFHIFLLKFDFIWPPSLNLVAILILFCVCVIVVWRFIWLYNI